MADTDDKAKRVITPVFRLSFPHFVVPQPSMTAGGKAKFGNMAVFVPAEFDVDDKKRWNDVLRIMNEASIKTFSLAYKDLPPNYKKPFHRGDEKKQYGFTDKMLFTNITSNVRPGFVKKDGKTKVTTEAEIESVFYPGCYCRASINAFGYKKGGGVGIAFGVNNVMFVRHGERLDNRVEADEEFADLGEEDTDSDLGLGDDLGLGEFQV